MGKKWSEMSREEKDGLKSELRDNEMQAREARQTMEASAKDKDTSGFVRFLSAIMGSLFGYCEKQNNTMNSILKDK